MAEFRVAVGEEFFEELRRNGCYYADKTELIYKIAEVGRARVTLFTRPRRFGKTLTMTMLRSFFDITRDSKDLFEGLAVSEYKDFCQNWQNQYPVLFISLKDVEGLNFDEAYAMLDSRIADLCKNVDCVIRGLMSSVLKTNPFLKFAVITGCLRISKESVFTGVNNFKTYSILDSKFSNVFGFTEAEVKKLLKPRLLRLQIFLRIP